MRWPLILFVIVLLVAFPNLLSLLGALAEQPVIVAFGLGVVAALWPRRRAAARARRSRR